MAPLFSGRIACWRAVALVAVVSLTVLTLAGCRDPGPPRSGTRSEDQARAQRIQRQFSSWDGSHTTLTAYIKRSLGSGETYEHIDTRFDDRYVNLALTVRFYVIDKAGKKIKHTLKAKVDLDGRILEITSRTP